MLHEDRHLLFNVVGIPDMRIEMEMEIPLEAGDTVLLACDGLFDNLAPDEVIEFLHSGDLVERTRHMIQLCLERMGGKNSSHPSKPDDLTVVAFRFQG